MIDGRFYADSEADQAIRDACSKGSAMALIGADPALRQKARVKAGAVTPSVDVKGGLKGPLRDAEPRPKVGYRQVPALQEGPSHANIPTAKTGSSSKLHGYLVKGRVRGASHTGSGVPRGKRANKLLPRASLADLTCCTSLHLTETLAHALVYGRYEHASRPMTGDQADGPPRNTPTSPQTQPNPDSPNPPQETETRVG